MIYMHHTMAESVQPLFDDYCNISSRGHIGFDSALSAG